MFRTVINYRREDSGGWAGRLYDRLAGHFGEDDIFLDNESIKTGQDYYSTIMSNIASCDVLIAVIGKRWPDCRDEGGRRRLEVEDDILRQEIRLALEKQVEVFPVLVDNAAMPDPKVLPEDIRPLAYKQAHPVAPSHFRMDVDELIEKLTLALKVAEERKRPLSLEETIRNLRQQLAEAERARQQELLERSGFMRTAASRDSTTSSGRAASYVEPAPPQVSAQPFNAFMVYSHSRDSALAAALQSALTQFAKPWYKMRSLRIFRDATNLSASPALWTSIREVLSSAEYLILLASPEAARSRWVQAEVEYWLKEQPASKILVALTGGEIAWDNSAADFDWSRTTALPESLRGAFREEPFYIDLRWARGDEYLSLRNPMFLDSVASFAAALHGRPKDDLVGRSVREQQRARRIMLALLLVFLILSTYAVLITAFLIRASK